MIYEDFPLPSSKLAQYLVLHRTTNLQALLKSVSFAGLHCITEEMQAPKKPQLQIFLPGTTTEPTLKTSSESTIDNGSNQSNSEEEMNKYFFFASHSHSTNTDPSHKDPFYSQQVHQQELTEENITDTSSNDIPEVVTEPESINETNLEYNIEATESPSIKTNSKLMDESVYKDALKLLSKITKEKTELREVTTISSFSEAKYRGNVEEPSPPIRHSTESLLEDRIAYDQRKYG